MVDYLAVAIPAGIIIIVICAVSVTILRRKKAKKALEDIKIRYAFNNVNINDFAANLPPIAQGAFGMMATAVNRQMIGGKWGSGNLGINFNERTKKRRANTQIIFNSQNLPLGSLVMRKRSFASSSNISTNDPAFDKTFTIESNNQQLVTSLLTPNRRQALIQLSKQYTFRIQVEGQKMMIKVNGLFLNINKYSAWLDFLKMI